MKNSAKRKTDVIKYFVIVLFLIAVVLGFYIGDYDFSENDNNIMYAYFLDVGQGDCSVFINGDGCILVDSGESEYADTVISELNKFNIDDIDLIIATHPHSDHIGGIGKILSAFNVDEIIVPKLSEDNLDSEIYYNMLETAEKNSVSVTYAYAGESFYINNMYIKILSPVDESSEMNNNSIVTYLNFGENDFVLSADAESEEEMDIIDKFENTDCDILKVGHHGSKSSSSDEYINALSPETVIISVGENNSYYLPSSETTDKLVSLKCDIYRTDNNGTISIKCDRNTYFVQCENQ